MTMLLGIGLMLLPYRAPGPDGALIREEQWV
jgi:hypothetical protein